MAVFEVQETYIHVYMCNAFIMIRYDDKCDLAKYTAVHHNILKTSGGRQMGRGGDFKLKEKRKGGWGDGLRTNTVLKSLNQG